MKATETWWAEMSYLEKTKVTKHYCRKCEVEWSGELHHIFSKFLYKIDAMVLNKVVLVSPAKSQSPA